MSRATKEIVAAATFLALFAGLAWLATDFGPRARMIPLPLAIVGMALAVVQIVLCLVGSPQERLRIIEVDETALPKGDSEPAPPAPTQKPARRGQHKTPLAHLVGEGSGEREETPSSRQTVSRESLQASLPQGGSGEMRVAAAGAIPPKPRPEWTAYAVVFAMTALIISVGPVIAIFVFTAAYFLRTRLYSTTRSLIYAALFTGSVHLLFFTTLQIEPYYGLLAPLLAHIR